MQMACLLEYVAATHRSRSRRSQACRSVLLYQKPNLQISHKINQIPPQLFHH